MQRYRLEGSERESKRGVCAALRVRRVGEGLAVLQRVRVG